MKNFIKINLIVALLFTTNGLTQPPQAGGVITGGPIKPVETIETVNKNPQWHVNYLNRRFKAITRDGSGINVMRASTMNIGSTINNPDDHGYTRYTLLKIEDDGVVFKYTSSFDHRSFAKNLIEKDSGTFKIKWKSLNN